MQAIQIAQIARKSPIFTLFAALAIIVGSLVGSGNPPRQKLNIVFDLGDVLVETDSFAVFKQTGFKAFGAYIAHNPRKLHSISAHIRYECLYKFLNTIQPRTAEQPEARDENGILLPSIMCDWLSGKSCSDIRQQIRSWAKEHPDYFTNTADRALALAMCKMMFTPDIFAATRRLIQPVADFVQECVANGDDVYILSNWDKESFAIFMQEYPEFFSLFKDIIITGECGVIKPDPAAFIYTLERNRLEADATLFYDDRDENVQAADDLGMHGFVCKRKHGGLFSKAQPNVKAMRKHYYFLRKQLLIPPIPEPVYTMKTI